MKRFLSILLLLLLLSACGQSRTAPSDEAPAIRVVTDSFGREVTIPAQVQTVVCTGSGALRMVSYLQCTDLLVGVEDTDKEYEISTLRDYAHVNHELFASLPSIGKGGGTGNTAYIEELIGLQPDVIVCRSELPLDDGIKDKISLFCNVEVHNVIENLDVDVLYEAPLALEKDAIMSGKIDTDNKKTVCVVSGGNIDSSRLIEVMTRGIKKREEE